VAGGLIAACTATGAAGAPADGTESGLGASAGGYFVWSSKDGVHGFRIAKKK
jgi:hypothetical protein